MISVGFMGLRYFSGMPAYAGSGPRLYDRYRPLLNDPDGVFDLPKDFSYKIISHLSLGLVMCRNRLVIIAPQQSTRTVRGFFLRSGLDVPVRDFSQV